jgi:hypothetical protein
MLQQRRHARRKLLNVVIRANRPPDLDAVLPGDTATPMTPAMLGFCEVLADEEAGHDDAEVDDKTRVAPASTANESKPSPTRLSRPMTRFRLVVDPGGGNDYLCGSSRLVQERELGARADAELGVGAREVVFDGAW